MPKEMPKPQDEVIYGSVPAKQYDRTRDHEVRFFAHTFGSARVVHIREFWKPKVDQTWRAGRGLTFKPEHLVAGMIAFSRMVVGENVAPTVPDALAEHVGNLIRDRVETSSGEVDFTEVARSILPDLLAAGALLETIGRTE